MKALFYPEFGALDVREVPPPEPGGAEVVLRVHACGLCGSELETFKNRSARRQPPLIMGHEFCGEVVAAGPGADRALVGQRFISNSVLSCGHCTRCARGDTHLCENREVFGIHRPGAFAEFVAVPVAALTAWPESLAATEACLAEPLANGIHVVNLTRHLDVKTALVIGAGPIGLMCQQALQAMRQVRTFVCDLTDERLAVARNLGAERTLCTRTREVLPAVMDWTAGEGVDLVVDAAGSGATKKLSLAAVRPGGAAVWIGLHADVIELESYAITLPEKQVLGTYAARMEELQAAVALMSQRAVDVSSWTQVAPLADAVAMFRRMLQPAGRDVKAVFVPLATGAVPSGASI